MEELKALVFKHRFTINKMRININDDVGYFGIKKKPFLIKGVYSNTVKEGRMLEIVQEMLPEASITEICLNKNVVCRPHKDKKNYGPSYVIYFGQFEGGALVSEESKQRYEEKEVWHGPFLGSEVTHYNEPIICGVKYSVVAYSRNG